MIKFLLPLLLSFSVRGATVGSSSVARPRSVVALTSAGYTVPAGRIAVVKYRLSNGALKVNGSIVDLASGNETIIQAGASTATGTTEVTFFTVSANSGGKMRFQASQSAATIVTCRLKRAGTTVAELPTNTGTVSVFVYVEPGDTVTYQNAASSAGNRSCTLYGTGELDEAFKTLNLPSGSVLTVDSDLPVGIKGIVELY